MKCRECGFDIAPDVAFCSHCGAPRPRLPAPFQEMVHRHADLVSQREAGDLDVDGFLSEVEKLMVVDDQGRTWKVGADGDWYRFEASGWQRREPPSAGVMQKTTEGDGTRRFLPWVLAAAGGGALLLIVGLAIAAVAFWPRISQLWASAEPTPTPMATAVAATPQPVPTVTLEEPTPTQPVSVLPTPEPTVPPWALEPVAPQPAHAELIFYDDFTEASGWRVSEAVSHTWAYGDAAYIGEILVQDRMAWRWAPWGAFADFTLDVDARLLTEADGARYGVIFRGMDGDNFYYFLVSGSGDYLVGKQLDDEWRDVEGPRSGTSEALNPPGERNRLTVVCAGDLMSFYANGQFLATLRDSSFAEGEVGLTVSSGEDGGRPRVAFERVEIRGARLPDVYLADDFSDPDSGWRVGVWEEGAAGYVNGAYAITSTVPNVAVAGWAHRSFRDVAIEVDATQVQAPEGNDNSFGITCRRTVTDGYALKISGDGYYGIFRLWDPVDDYRPLVPWTRSSAINQGYATNHFLVVCNGPLLSLYINGEHLATVHDDAVKVGDVGFESGSLEHDVPNVIHYDNVEVRRPSLLILPLVLRQ